MKVWTLQSSGELRSNGINGQKRKSKTSEYVVVIFFQVHSLIFI